MDNDSDNNLNDSSLKENESIDNDKMNYLDKEKWDSLINLIEDLELERNEKNSEIDSKKENVIKNFIATIKRAKNQLVNSLNKKENQNLKPRKRETDSIDDEKEDIKKDDYDFKKKKKFPKKKIYKNIVNIY